MIVLVTGGRDFGNHPAEHSRLCDALWTLNHAAGTTCVVHGYARGADSVAREWAENRIGDGLNVTVQGFRADWQRLGRAAGHERNGRMVAWCKAKADGGDRVIVLACPGGKGTANCVEQAKRAGLVVKTLDEVLGGDDPKKEGGNL